MPSACGRDRQVYFWKWGAVGILKVGMVEVLGWAGGIFCPTLLPHSTSCQYTKTCYLHLLTCYLFLFLFLLLVPIYNI
jgi:hypothetical protein